MCNHLLPFHHAFRLQACVILITGSEVSGKVLSWLHNLLYLFNCSCIKGGSWLGWELSIYLVSWLLIRNIYDNYTEYLRSIFIINGDRFLLLTKITLVIYSNT